MPKELTFANRADAPKQSYYITTAIAYLNGPPHAGHAYEFVTTDVISRYHQIAGRDTFMVSGGDEHGQKMATTAEKAGLTPQQLCDKNVQYFYTLFETLDIGKHHFERTTNDVHIQAAQWIWNRAVERDAIYLGSYVGWYNVREETFVTDREAELTNFADPLSKVPYERRDEKSYFFRLSKYHDKVYELIKNTEYVQPVTRRNELLARLEKEPLEDLSVSRETLSWGIPVPGDDKHVMYVWFDALVTYLSSLRYNQTDSPTAKFWPASVHIIGKDIVWFHAVIWPAMLMACDIPLPDKIFGHGFVQAADGMKMGKSLGNSLDPMACLKLVGSDTFRWYLIKEAHYGADMRFGYPALVDMHNSDLCATMGNLLHRALALCDKANEGKVPAVDCEQIVDVAAAYDKAEAAMGEFALEQLAGIGLDICKHANKYLTDKAPWKIKDDQEAKLKIIRSVMEALYVAAHFLWPIMPKAGELIMTRLGAPRKALWELTDGLNLITGAPIALGEVLFTRLELPKEEEASPDVQDAKQTDGQQKKKQSDGASKKKNDGQKK